MFLRRFGLLGFYKSLTSIGIEWVHRTVELHTTQQQVM